VLLNLRSRYFFSVFMLSYHYSLIFSNHRSILKRMAAKERLVIAPQTAKEVVRLVARGRRLDGFGNAGAVETILGRAKVNKSTRLVRQLGERSEMQRAGVSPLPPAPRPDVLLIEDFITEETSGAKARDQMTGMMNMDHIFKLIDRLESTMIQAKEENKTPAEILANFNMIFTGPPGKQLYVDCVLLKVQNNRCSFLCFFVLRCDNKRCVVR
jgi:hypothetical protein